MARRAAKVDGNHALIAAAFEAAGCSVQSLAPVGSGCPDLLIGLLGVNLVVEVKDPAQAVSARRLNPIQKRWHEGWKGKAHVVETVEQVVLIVSHVKDMLRRT